MTTQRLIKNLVDYLGEYKPSPDIAVVDATQRAEIALPTLTVGIASVEAHSIALANVQRCQVEITLRCHSGDEDDAETTTWQDVVETILNDPSLVKAVCNDGIRIDFWNYEGAESSWDESTLEVKYSAQCLATRI